MCKKRCVDEPNELELLRREMRNVLNKLTPGNFCFDEKNKKLTKLIAQLMTSDERLNECEHTSHEHTYTVLYAALCKSLVPIKVASSNSSNSCKPNKLVTFSGLLIKRCQIEFETVYSAINDNYDEEKLAKARHRAIGSTRLVGRLFNVDILGPPVMNIIGEYLLMRESTREAELERFCILLAIIGKKLDKPIYARHLNRYFDHIRRIVFNTERAIRPRIRFMLLDVIDLRERKWTPRPRCISLR